MAEQKKTTTKKTTTTTTSSKHSEVWGINKISFYTIGAMAILYLLASILSLCGLNLVVIQVLQGLATAISICICGYLAWKYVKHKPTVWKVLFLVLLLVVLLGIIIPMI